MLNEELGTDFLPSSFLISKCGGNSPYLHLLHYDIRPELMQKAIIILTNDNSVI
jgi:hypothetical protein